MWDPRLWSFNISVQIDLAMHTGIIIRSRAISTSRGIDDTNSFQGRTLMPPNKSVPVFSPSFSEVIADRMSGSNQ